MTAEPDNVLQIIGHPRRVAKHGKLIHGYCLVLEQLKPVRLLDVEFTEKIKSLNFVKLHTDAETVSLLR